MAAPAMAGSTCDLLTLRVEPSVLEHYRRQLDLPDPSAALEALAEAVASSEDWGSLPPAALAVATRPEPLLGVFGCFDDAPTAWLERQLGELPAICGGIRYIGYRQAERDCARLAERLREELGADALSAARFTAIPRGGLLVLGMLSYLLGLSAEQLSGSVGRSRLLVVVDDCALSGARLRHALEHSDAPEVVFAHLYSHPDLRVEVVAREPRVRSCVAVRDLRDRGPELLGKAYPEWRRERRLRLPGDRFWIGFPEQICFAWGEPERPLWDPERGELRLGWNLVPPSHCLGHDARARSKGPRVWRQISGRGPLLAGEAVLAAEVGGRRVLADLASGQTFRLSAVAARMWEALLGSGSKAAAATLLDGVWDVGGARLRADLDSFVDELMRRGLMRTGGEANAAAAGRG